MALACISDIYRRFKLEFSVPPFTIFGWMDLSTADFVKSFSRLESRFHQCPHCLDFGLASALVGQFQGLEQQPHDRQCEIHAEISALLRDISIWCPLTSDVVEIKNGQVQLVLIIILWPLSLSVVFLSDDDDDPFFYAIYSQCHKFF